MNKHIVIYSHGFGVEKDDRGLFLDIASALPDAEHVMFDYGAVDKEAKTLTVSSLTDQVKKLESVIAQNVADNPGATLDLICHSQGCVVAALLMPTAFRKVIFTGPPAKLSVDDMIRLFSSRPSSEININGISRLNRADFSTTIVPPEYWKSIENLNPVELYNELSKVTPLVLINGTEDEIIGSRDFSGLNPNIKVIGIKTGHNFEGEGRKQLLDAVKKVLS